MPKALSHKYTRRWKGPDGRWNYEYAKESPQTSTVLASREEQDLVRSLRNVANADGYWKSKKQGQFMLDKLKGESSMTASAWAQDTFDWFDPEKHIALESLKRLDAFGKQDPSKIRYAAHFIILDGSGVKALARAKYDHQANITVPEHKDIQFVRRGGEKPEVHVDLEAQEREQVQRMKDAVERNRPLLEKIKAEIDRRIDEDKNIDFLTSIRNRLTSGFDLSPGQRQALERMLPGSGAMDMPPREKWPERLHEFWKQAEAKVLPLVLFEAEGQPEQEEWIRREWEKLKRGEGTPLTGQVEATLEKLGKDLYPWTQTGVSGLQELTVQIPKGAKARKGPTKKATTHAIWMAGALEKLRNMTDRDVVQAYTAGGVASNRPEFQQRVHAALDRFGAQPMPDPEPEPEAPATAGPAVPPIQIPKALEVTLNLDNVTPEREMTVERKGRSLIVQPHNEASARRLMDDLRSVARGGYTGIDATAKVKQAAKQALKRLDAAPPAPAPEPMALDESVIQVRDAEKRIEVAKQQIKAQGTEPHDLHRITTLVREWADAEIEAKPGDLHQQVIGLARARHELVQQMRNTIAARNAAPPEERPSAEQDLRDLNAEIARFDEDFGKRLFPGVKPGWARSFGYRIESWNVTKPADVDKLLAAHPPERDAFTGTDPAAQPKTHVEEPEPETKVPLSPKGRPPGLYTQRHAPAVREWLDGGANDTVKGTYLRDTVFDRMKGGGGEANYEAKEAINELVDRGILIPGAFSPTTSDRAFLGLSYRGRLENHAANPDFQRAHAHLFRYEVRGTKETLDQAVGVEGARGGRESTEGVPAPAQDEVWLTAREYINQAPPAIRRYMDRGHIHARKDGWSGLREMNRQDAQKVIQHLDKVFAMEGESDGFGQVTRVGRSGERGQMRWTYTSPAGVLIVEGRRGGPSFSFQYSTQDNAVMDRIGKPVEKIERMDPAANLGDRVEHQPPDESAPRPTETEAGEKVGETINSSGVKATIYAGRHTKKLHSIWTVQLDTRVDREAFSDLRRKAKLLGGYYSSYRGGGAKQGFVFVEPANAQKFAQQVMGTEEKAPEVFDRAQATGARGAGPQFREMEDERKQAFNLRTTGTKSGEPKPEPAPRPAGKPWTATGEAWSGVTRPHIGEISNVQYQRMSQRQRKEYNAKRSREWAASGRAQQSWADALLQAYRNGEFALDDPDVHPEAKKTVRNLDLADKKQSRAQSWMDYAQTANTPNIAVGETVFGLVPRRYGTIDKVLKDHVWLKFPDGKREKWATSMMRRLSHDDLEIEFREKFPNAVMDAVRDLGDRGKTPEKLVTQHVNFLLRGNLGIDRADMPQIRKNVVGTFMEDLKESGVSVVQQPRRVTALRSTQARMSPEAVRDMMNRKAENPDWNRPIIVSSDGYVLDGHHRWAARRIDDPQAEIETVTVGLPIRALLERARAFKGVGYSEKSMGEMMDLEDWLSKAITPVGGITPGGNRVVMIDGQRAYVPVGKEKRVVDQKDRVHPHDPLPPDKTPAQHIAIAKAFLDQHAEHLEEKLQNLREVVPQNATVKGRVKNLRSAVRKVIAKYRQRGDASQYKTVADLQDGTGTRIVLDSNEAVADVVGKLRERYKVLDEDNYIAKPQGDYRSHHLILEDRHGMAFEVQVRTRNQDVFADWSHEVYKPAKGDVQTKLKFQNHPDVATYSSGMATFFAAQDEGRNPPPPNRPPCNATVARVFGCIG